jgi:outer membrane immunogenic protein
MKTILLASAAAVVMVGAASAADLPLAPPAFSWTGCYLGGFLGGAWTEGVTISNGYAQLPGFPNSAWGYSLSNSLIGGGTLGCNWQPVGTPWVLGIEGELGSIHMTGAGSDPQFLLGPNLLSASAKIGDWYGLVTGRAGLSFDRLLFYVKAGAAFVDETATVTHPEFAGVTPAVIAAANNKNNVYWTLGGGVEWAFAGNWTVKAEYMFIGTDNNLSCAFNPGDGGLIPAGTYCWKHSGLDGINTAKIGLNYLFGGGAPLVAPD